MRTEATCGVINCRNELTFISGVVPWDAGGVLRIGGMLSNKERVVSSQSWTIGATGECDVVVSEPTVSGRHCQLIRTPEGYLLKDLGSTNGTYVNGERVTDPRRVTAADHITLGTAVPLPWPSHLLAPGSRTIRIGRAATNHVVVAGEGVADHHAQLTMHRGTLTLEDLGTPAGTSVGTPGRQITRTTVKIGDTIYLGSTPLQVAAVVNACQVEQVARKDGQPAVVADAAPAEDSLPYGTGTLIAVAAGGALLMALLVALIIYAVGGAGEGRELANNQIAEPRGAETTQQIQVVAGERPQEDGADARVKEGGATALSLPPANAPPATVAPLDKRPTDALFLVLVGGEDGKFFRVGTAWAVAPHTLVSSASVVMRMRDLQERFPQAVVVGAARNEKISIVRTKVHPQYVLAATDCDKAEQELNALCAKYDAAQPTEIAREEIRDAWLEGELKALKAAERQVYFDAATIEVEQLLDVFLTPAPVLDAQALRPNLAVRAMGLAFDFKDPFFDPAAADMVWTLDGRIGRLVSYDEDAPRAQRLLVHLEPARPNETVRGQLEYVYVGSPVVTDAGQVVAIYSRPTPAREPNQPPDGRSFDATLFDRARSNGVREVNFRSTYFSGVGTCSKMPCGCFRAVRVWSSKSTGS